jgi:hypothetical protein
MKAFEFVAFNSSGEKKLGTVSAWSLSEAKRKIKRRGFYLASIEIQGSSVGSGVFPIQSGINREGIRGTSSHGQNYFFLFKELKEFFFPREKICI